MSNLSRRDYLNFLRVMSGPDFPIHGQETHHCGVAVMEIGVDVPSFDGNKHLISSS
jgi:hypothetical protein